ncbi:MAG: bifunctional [glutamate--ammonia ligase]-adenylyl-L-tyrosine phosphorylase/[glutamate--ammonia-ligase] adenylyltransferase, partial [Gammaproteobacteria bacterium]|nr:bifunctional [glutamate--ammonia ligase]-adenylyl-L-tyrosine phosphorylase/[glutamate--ammonia-ligase] adenylyltransferase [Gammaproteobacteria bacterium]
PRHPEFLSALHRVWAVSEFVARSCIREPQLLRELLDSGDLLADYAVGAYPQRVEAALRAAPDAQTLGEELRRLRRREMVRIAWRDLAGWAALDETLRDLSLLAQACLHGAVQRLHAWHSREWGVPRAADGSAQAPVVIGMGKLGAWELNFSSDVDLIFAYPEDGVTDAPQPLGNEEYFTRLARRFIDIISKPSVEGFVFRVDLRLRPYGDSGPLVMSFGAMEEYYQTQGRDWERYALIKARPVAGDLAAGERLLERLRPFVYRRYLDYGAFEALRAMKALISREVETKGLQDDIKRGAGGIREVEFIGQAFQLIRGGREPALRERRVVPLLRELARRGHLPNYAARVLSEAYAFLRRAENHLQEVGDQQVHRLPADMLERARLAFAMGYPDWAAFAHELERHRRRVQNHFEQVFAAPQADIEPAAGGANPAGLWPHELSDPQAVQRLHAAGFDDPEEALRRLQQLRDGLRYRTLSAQGRERMDRLIPLLLGAAAATERPTVCLSRALGLVEAIAGRSVYLALLVENPLALSQLVRLLAASPWLAALLTRHPLLLDELLDPRTLYTPPDRAELEQELARVLREVDAQDLEQQMERLRQFKQANVLRVAAIDVAGSMPLMVVSDHLTWIAETVLRRVLELARVQLSARHGRPLYRADGRPKGAHFIIIGYGKLGGAELSYGSDLDLVFLYEGARRPEPAAGSKSMDEDVFFTRLGQRVIHILTTQTPGGVLYEVDMRLRPSGESGLLVSSLDAFAEYQRRDAWTWEHQALVRARPVAGDLRLAGRFSEIRREVLARERDSVALRREVREMRGRMRAELARESAGCFDLKQGRGGIADIEFMVQYGVLLWARRHPELLRYTGNIRLLQGLAQAGVMAPEDAALLIDAYRAYRSRVHALTLQQEPAVVREQELQALRAGVSRMWQALMEEPPQE